MEKTHDSHSIMKHTLAFFLALLAAVSGSAAGPKQKPNVVVILADDLGWADLSCYGSTFHETPNLDELAAEGMRFTQGYAAHSYCSPTRAAILTGRNPARLKITDYIPSNNKTGKYLPAEINKELPLEEVTLAEILRDAGYATWHVGKWHLGHGEEFLPERQGFDINIAGNQSGMPASFFWPYGHDMPKRKNAYHGAPVPGLVEGGKKGEHLCDRITREAIGLIEKRDPSKPFFLYLPFYDVHTPIQAKPELIEKYEAKAEKMGLPTPNEAKRFREGDGAQGSQRRDHLVFQCNPTYAAMVETMDDNVGRLMASLDRLELTENTLVIFTSDNGGLNQHNFGRTPVTSNAPLRAGKGWLYEGGVREPWIVRLPGVTPPGSTCEVPVVATDISPTVLEVCGLPARPDLHLDGKSILPLLKGGTEPVHEFIQWHFPHYGNTGSGPCSSIRVGDWKLIEWFENDTVELFNLATDLGETTDLAAKHPDKTVELKKRLATWRKEVDANMLRPKPVGRTTRPVSSRRIQAQGDFAATANVRVEKLDDDAGYQLHASDSAQELDRTAFFAAPDFKEVPPNVEVLSETSAEGVTTQEILFAGGDFNGKPTRIHAYYSRPAAEGKYPAVVQLHGAGFRKLTPNATVFYARNGFACLSLDWAGKAKDRPELRSEFNSPGRLARRLPEAERDQAPPRGWRTFGREVDGIRAGVLFARRAAMFLRSRPEVDGDRLCLSGKSAGAHLSLLVLGVEPAFCAAAVKYGTGFIDDIRIGGYFGPITMTHRREQKEWLAAYDPKHGIQNFRASTLILSGTDDIFFWMPSVLQTYRAVPSEKRLIMRPNDNHRQVGNHQIPLAWFKSVLGTGATWPTIKSLTASVADGQLNLRTSAAAAPGIKRVEFVFKRQPLKVFHWGRRKDPNRSARWAVETATKDGDTWTLSIPAPADGEQLVAYATAYDILGREVSTDTIEVPEYPAWRVRTPNTR